VVRNFFSSFISVFGMRSDLEKKNTRDIYTYISRIASRGDPNLDPHFAEL